jgi:hypothetical protein
MLSRRCSGFFNFPIGRSILDSPEIARNIKLQAHQPRFRFATEGDYLSYASSSVPFGGDNFETHSDALRQSARRYQATSVRIDQGRIATFREIQPRIEAGQQHWNFKRQPTATPDGVLILRRVHILVGGQIRCLTSDLATSFFGILMLQIC